MQDLLLRLRERKLVQWALAYIAAAFALIQVIDVVAQRFGWPDALERVLILALVLGFFVTLVLAWYHGEKGAQKITSTELAILTLLLGIGVVLIWRMAQAPGVATTPNVRAGAKESATSIPDKSIAVLPLMNESGEKDQQYFSDGLSEDLITALSQFAGLKVIARESSFKFRNSGDNAKTIGAKLGVAHLLEGSVQRAGDVVRVSATLIKAADGSAIWSQHYDRPYKDLFALQDDITQQVAVALKAELMGAADARVKSQSDRPPGGSVAAYDALLDGNFNAAQESETSLRKAVVAFQRATAQDPAYAMAYARLSMAWTELAGTVLDSASPERPQAIAEARKAADTALRLDPDLAETHVARGFLMAWALLDWRGAEVEFNKALAIDPGNRDAMHLLADTLATLGRAEDAIRLDQRVLETNPLDAGTYAALAYFYSGLWQLDDAEHAIRRAIALQPDGIANQANLALVLVQRGDAKDALQAAKAETTAGNRAWALALAYAASADRTAAGAALKDFIARFADDMAYNIAEVYAYRRQPDQAFVWLDRARDQNDGGIQYLLYDPFLLHYKDDPRFAAFCKKVGLPTTTDANAMP